jgi:hypothetical protein
MSQFDELVCKKISTYLDKSLFIVHITVINRTVHIAAINSRSYNYAQIVTAENISEAFDIWQKNMFIDDTNKEDPILEEIIDVFLSNPFRFDQMSNEIRYPYRNQPGFSYHLYKYGLGAIEFHITECKNHYPITNIIRIS